MVSVHNRVVGKVPLPTARGILELKKERNRMAACFGHLVPWDLERTVESFTGARRARYQRAYESLLVDPLDTKDGRIQSFVKAEKFDPLVKENPDPRMIQARTPRYNLMIAKYLRPVEHIIYNLTGASGLRQVAKGMNARMRASVLVEKFSLFKRPVCISLDCSRFDKHIAPANLDIEHGFYQQLMPGFPELDRLLSWQKKNHCRCKNGVKYVVTGGRMSGDINTALGNVVIMILDIKASMRRLQLKRYEIFDDGDDGLLIIEEDDYQKVVENISAIFLDYGQELKIESVARDISDVVFCQSKIVHVNGEPIFVRDWRKVLSHACCGTKHWNDPHLVRPMMGLVGSCELVLGAGVPIVQAFAEALLRNAGGVVANSLNVESGLEYRVKLELGSNWYDKILEKRSVVVTDATRLSFERVWGVPIWEQLAIEKVLAGWVLESTEAVTVPQEWDHRWQDGRSLSVLPPLLL